MKVFEQKPTRFGYGEGLLELGATNPNVLVLDADLAKSTTTQWFKEKYPDRFFEVGIAEQNMLGIAAGMALGGYIPFVTTYGVFVAGRAWDQIRTTVCFSKIGVKIAGAHGGISVGPDGATHQALEEITIMRVLPNMTVLSPCDAIEAKKATVAATQIDGPVYIRFGREAVPVFTTPDDPFILGKANLLKQGSDVAIIATGHLVYHALVAAELLAKESIDAMVINVHTIKPLDEQALIKAAQKTKAVVSCEEHQVFGGLGGALAEVFAKNCPVKMKMIGMEDCFGTSGTPEELMDRFKMTGDHIYKAAMDLLVKGNRK